MGGFLSGLGELLGGWNAQRRIDTEGFDWREKAAQDEFLRQRQQEVARQSDEDRAQAQLTDYLSAQDFGSEPDVSGAEPLLAGIDTAKRKAFLTTALGKRKQQKDYLAERKAQSDAYNQMLRNQGGVERVQATAAAAVPGREDTQAHQMELLKARLEAAEREGSLNREMARTLAELRATNFGMGRKTSYTKLSGTDEQGRTGTWLIDNLSGEREFMPAGPTAATRGKEEAKGAALNAYNELMGVYDTIGGQYDTGPVARAAGAWRKGKALVGEAPEVKTYQDGVRGFVPLMARALGHVGVLTELDVERTEALFPKVGDTEAEKAQKKRLLEDIMTGKSQFRFEHDTRQVGESPSIGGDLPRPASRAEFDALPSGTRFVGPDGKVRRKP